MSIINEISKNFKKDFSNKGIRDSIKLISSKFDIKNIFVLFINEKKDIFFITERNCYNEISVEDKKRIFLYTEKLFENSNEESFLLDKGEIQTFYKNFNIIPELSSDFLLKINFLTFKGKFIGAVFYSVDENKTKDCSDYDVMDFFTNQINVYMEIEYLKNEIKITSEKIKALHSIALKIEKGTTEKEVINLGEIAIKSILKYDHYTFDLVEGDVFVVRADSFDGEVNVSNYPLDEPGIATKVYKTKIPYLSGDLQNDPEADPTSDLFSSAITLPIGNIGIFQAISYEKNAFSEQDIELTELVISSIGEVIERIRKESEIKYMSYHDSLTNLLNRTFLKKERDSIDRFNNLPIAVILGDVNGLKVINDAFGHNFGDKLLKRFSQIFLKCCRNTDIVIRLSGDEFLFFLPGTTYEQGLHIIDRMERECEKVKDLPIPLSISFGISVKTEKDQKISELMEIAENEMYKKKSVLGLKARKKIIEVLKNKADKVAELKGKNLALIKNISLKIAKELEFSEEKKQLLEKFIDLHEIGEITMEKNINLKNEENYTKEEWEIALRHPVKGYSIARANDETVSIAEDILSHHEKWDGSGYPRGISKNKIPINARIVAISEHYERKVYGRSYLKPQDKNVVLSEIKEMSGSFFDPKLVEIFLKII